MGSSWPASWSPWEPWGTRIGRRRLLMLGAAGFRSRVGGGCVLSERGHADRGPRSARARRGEVVVQITLRRGRSPQAKRDLYARIADLAAANAGIDPKNILVSLVETDSADWSFGAGRAQLLEAEAAATDSGTKPWTGFVREIFWVDVDLRGSVRQWGGPTVRAGAAGPGGTRFGVGSRVLPGRQPCAR